MSTHTYMRVRGMSAYARRLARFLFAITHCARYLFDLIVLEKAFNSPAFEKPRTTEGKVAEES